ncbi:hypothetical protein T02_8396 [Trichinella nativa]|uniref:Uncharacterized protein n=1 Tax=Trichinella nativa TaxID=6335 RepID=A0A0V1LJS9_9BILA|nr:hypothetical protein T02_8396 [Trichinella nativa]
MRSAFTSAVCTFQQSCECQITANTCLFCSYTPLMLYNPTQLSESCKGYHRLLIYVLNIYPRKNHWCVLACKLARSGCTVRRIHLRSGPIEQSWPSVWNHGTGAAGNQPPVHSVSFPFILIISSDYLAFQFGCRHHYCYGVEQHERRQPLNLQIHSIHTH